MDAIIKCLDVNEVDRFINHATENYGRVTRRETSLEQTVDLLFNVLTIAVDENQILIELPDGSCCLIKCPSKYYHKIEVL